MNISTRSNPMLILVAMILSSCGGGASGGGSGQADQSVGIWTINEDEVIDGGPGRDGIPPLQNPIYESAATIQSVNEHALVIAVRYGDQVIVYPHDIMDWHEIVNDGTADDPFTMSYCPLTGSAMVWKGNIDHADPTFGTSGLLYNSNLILYDRETSSFWAQMLLRSVSGERINDQADQFQVIETVFSTLRKMYPNASVMTRDTGYTSYSYSAYPYGSYRANTDLLFPVRNSDERLHPKTRVIGIRSGQLARAYQIAGFDATTQVINDQIGDLSIVIIGNSELNFASIYDRTMADGTILNFTAVENDLPNVLTDDEGNIWDIFGKAVSGPRVGDQLGQTKSYTSYWFAWAAFFPSSELFFNQI